MDGLSAQVGLNTAPANRIGSSEAEAKLSLDGLSLETNGQLAEYYGELPGATESMAHALGKVAAVSLLSATGAWSTIDARGCYGYSGHKISGLFHSYFAGA